VCPETTLVAIMAFSTPQSHRKIHLVRSPGIASQALIAVNLPNFWFSMASRLPFISAPLNNKTRTQSVAIDEWLGIPLAGGPSITPGWVRVLYAM
jgi:hypothetical protein